MRGNIVAAASVLGLALVISSAVCILGARWVLNGAVGRLDQAVQEHGLRGRAGRRTGGGAHPGGSERRGWGFRPARPGVGAGGR